MVVVVVVVKLRSVVDELVGNWRDVRGVFEVAMLEAGLLRIDAAAEKLRADENPLRQAQALILHAVVGGNMMGQFRGCQLDVRSRGNPSKNSCVQA